MSNDMILKDKMPEMIGVFSQNSIQSVLESEFEKLPYLFNSFNDLISLEGWIRTNRPRVVLLEHDLLDSAAQQGSLDSFKETLKTFEVLSIILTQAIKDIHQWRNQAWPHLHFYHGSVQTRLLKEKIINLLSERYFTEQPLVAIISEKPYLLANLEMNLKNYGLRVLPIHPPHVSDKLIEIASESIDAILWDVAMWDEEKKALINKNLHRFSEGALPSIFFVSESWPLNDGSPVQEQSWKEEIYTPIKSTQLISKLMDVVLERRKMKLIACRDFTTGLYLPETFIHLAKNEIAQALRREESFSIMRVRIGNIKQVESEYGSIFSKELELNLGLFIQNRVRSSDLVVRCNTGEVLILFSRVNKEIALLIGEKLQHHFIKAASFNEGSQSQFIPKLEYSIYNYPADIDKVEDVEAILKGQISGLETTKVSTSAESA